MTDPFEIRVGIDSDASDDGLHWTDPRFRVGRIRTITLSVVYEGETAVEFTCFEMKTSGAGLEALELLVDLANQAAARIAPI